MSTVVRRPAVAGRFYPSRPDVLLQDLRSYLAPAAERIQAIGCIAPHAGYMYSGHVAGAVYAKLELPDRFVILCPNHTGMGKPLAIMSEGEWETPLGSARIDTPLALELRKRFPPLNEDMEAHRSEHALEVQLPFLQQQKRDFTFVPIAFGVGAYDVLSAFGVALAEALAAQRDSILIVASSDMNHYESDAVTRVKDAKAIDEILKLDAKGLFDVVVREDISMCGYGPAVSMLTAATRLGAKSAELVKYATSGDVSGDRDLVVGYAGVVVK
jgi:AmmeMemoRadiSam system protein B